LYVIFCTGTERKLSWFKTKSQRLVWMDKSIKYLAVITKFETEIQTLDFRITNQDSKPLHRNFRWLLIRPIFYLLYVLTIIFINKILKSTL